MGELEGKISEILNSPEDMKKIMSIARSLAGGDESADKPDSVAEADSPLASTVSAAQAAAPQGESEPPADSLLDNLKITPETIETLGAVISGLTSTTGDTMTSLLDSMTPLLKQERREQLKRACSLAKMAKVALAIFAHPDGGS